jgi:hypothetical protein
LVGLGWFGHPNTIYPKKLKKKKKKKKERKENGFCPLGGDRITFVAHGGGSANP